MRRLRWLTCMSALFVSSAASSNMPPKSEAESANSTEYQLSAKLKALADQAPCHSISGIKDKEIDWQSIKSDEEARSCLGLIALEKNPTEMVAWLKAQGFESVAPYRAKGGHFDSYASASWMTSQRGLLYWPGFFSCGSSKISVALSASINSLELILRN